MKILIVGDDFTSRKFMLKFLSKYGECDITVDGQEAVDALLWHWRRTGYDLICLDIMMPILDGFETLKQIREMEDKLGIPETKRLRLS